MNIGDSAEPCEISMCLFQSLMPFIFLSIIIKNKKNNKKKKKRKKKKKKRYLSI